MNEVPTVKIQLEELMWQRKIKTIEQLKEKTGLSRKAISAAMNNKNTKMSFETIAKLCKALDCKVNDLIVLVEKDEGERETEVHKKKR